jgi:uncharacterized protein
VSTGSLAEVGSRAAAADADALLALRSVDDGRLICARVHHARSFAQRLVGLIGRRTLGPDEGLFLPGTSSIHMLFMRFAIDCLFVSRPDAEGARRVTAIRQDLRPWSGVVWHVRRTEGVIELPAGALARMRVQVGDAVRLEASTATG